MAKETVKKDGEKTGGDDTNTVSDDQKFKDTINKVVDEAKADVKATADKDKHADVDPDKDKDKDKDPDKDKKVDKSSAFAQMNKDDEPDPDKDPDKDKDLEEITLPEGTPEKVSDSFAKQRVQHREIVTAKDKEIETLKKQVAEGSPDNEATKQLTDQNATLVKRLSQLDVKQSPEFKEKILDPREKIKEQLEQLFKDNKIESSVDSLLAKTGNTLALAVDEIAEKVSTSMGKNKLARLAEGWDVLADMEQAIVQNADTASNALHENNQKRMEDVFQDRYTAVTGEHGMLMDKLEAGKDADEKEIASVKNHNEGIDRLNNRAHELATRKDLTEKDIADMATMAALGEFYTFSGIPRLNVEYMSMSGMLTAAVQKIIELEGGSPAPKGGDGGSDDSGGSKASKDGKYSEKEYRSVVERIAGEMAKAT